MCKVNPKLVESWLQSLTNIRNQCAHYGRLYNTLFDPVQLKKDDKKYDINARSLFAYVLIIKYLISDRKVWNKFFINLQQLVNEYETNIDLRLMGFTENWIEILSKS